MKRVFLISAILIMVAATAFGRTVLGSVASKGTGSMTIGALEGATILRFLAQEDGNVVITERHNELIIPLEAVEFAILALDDANRIASNTETTVARRAEPFTIPVKAGLQAYIQEQNRREALIISATTGTGGDPGYVYITIGGQIIVLSAGDYGVDYDSAAAAASKSEVVRLIERLSETLELASTLSEESDVAEWSEDVVQAYEELVGVTVAAAGE